MWSVAIAATGGFNTRFLGIRLSSRDPFDAAMIAVVSAAIASTLRRSEPHTRTRTACRWIQPSFLLAGLGIALVVNQWAAGRPLWLDEEMIAINVRDRTISTLAGKLWLEQAAPFGWLALQRTALLAFGTDELSLRLIPAFFGVSTLICAAWIGHRWMTPIGATAFLLMCSFGQWLSFLCRRAQTLFG